VSPELLDVIDSPAGKLSVIWQEHSHDSRDQMVWTRGYQVSGTYYKSFDTGETLGFVNTVEMNDTSFARAFGDDEFTTFRYAQDSSGSHYGFRNADEEPETEEDVRVIRQRLWVYAQQAAGRGITAPSGERVASYNVSDKHLPDEATILKDLEASRKPFEEEILLKKQDLSTPVIDYSEMPKPLKGKGLGANLYVYTARRLAKSGKALRGSGIQSNSAAALWGKFKEHSPDNVREITMSKDYDNETYLTLDFRTN
jgi:hypothetical protein